MLKPSVCFEVQKIIGISTSEGNKTYQVQWAPSWISGAHLIGCEDLIEQFEYEQENKDNINVQVVLEYDSKDGSGMEVDVDNDELLHHSHRTQHHTNVYSTVDNRRFVNANRSEDKSLVFNGGVNDGVIQDTNIANQQFKGNTHVIHLRSQLQNENNNKDDGGVQVAPVHSSIQNKYQTNSKQYCNGNAKIQVVILESNMADEDEGVSLQPDDVQVSNECSDRNLEGNTLVLSQTTNDAHTKRSQLPLTHSNKESTNIDIVTPGKTHEYNNTQLNEESGKVQGKLDESLDSRKDFKHECYTCHRRFKRKDQLRRHEMRHTDGKQFSCNLCKKIFTDNEELLLHIELHKIKDRRFKCDLCVKTCHTLSDLKKHTMVHTGERPFECSVCHNKFRRNYHLQRHMSTHAQENKSHENTSTSCAQENTSTSCAQEKKSPSCAQENTSPSCAQENTSPSCAQGNTSPSCAQENKLPSCAQENKLPSCALQNKSPVYSQENRSLSDAQKNRSL